MDQRAARKPYRNDPCPCGSGRKTRRIPASKARR
ncbi:MAG: SEC-C metal-binding domain-containing protein [Actinomycetota bacterium]|nr:SEC-C metal-binding domain-containing protein [Actinomycetota bacterium]